MYVESWAVVQEPHRLPQSGDGSEQPLISAGPTSSVPTTSVQRLAPVAGIVRNAVGNHFRTRGAADDVLHVEDDFKVRDRFRRCDLLQETAERSLVQDKVGRAFGAGG